MEAWAAGSAQTVAEDPSSRRHGRRWDPAALEDRALEEEGRPCVDRREEEGHRGPEEGRDPKDDRAADRDDRAVGANLDRA